MSNLKIATTDNTDTVLYESTLKAFRASLRGELLRDGDAGYAEARRIHNGMIDRQPALIARCAGVADVMSAVRFASNHNLLISVRGGGHGVPGFAICERGLMIDLSRMKSIHVDPKRRVARAEPGVTWGEFDHETQAFGLATTGGVLRPTGIAGLTLAGGHGLLMRKHGLTCDNLLSVDLVTAEARLLTASDTENAELFWGLRGGGGNFGIVTSFEYRLHPVGLMLGGLLIYPIDQAKDILRFYHKFMTTAPDELGSLAAIGTSPDGTKAVIILLGYDGPIDEGERVLRPLRTFGAPLDQVGPLPYTALQSIIENFNPPGLRYYWKSSFLQELSEEAIDTIIECFARVPAPHTHVIIYTLGGAVSRVRQETTAVASRDSRYALVLIGMWNDPAEDERSISWVREFWSAMQSFSSGGFYVNYEADAESERVRDAYGVKTYERLAALKRRYDPQNLFRLNQNIEPH